MQAGERSWLQSENLPNAITSGAVSDVKMGCHGNQSSGHLREPQTGKTLDSTGAERRLQSTSISLAAVGKYLMHVFLPSASGFSPVKLRSWDGSHISDKHVIYSWNSGIYKKNQAQTPPNETFKNPPFYPGYTIILLFFLSSFFFSLYFTCFYLCILYYILYIMFGHSLLLLFTCFYLFFMYCDICV